MQYRDASINGDGHRLGEVYVARGVSTGVLIRARSELAFAHSLRRLKALRNIRAAVAGTGFIGVVHVEALRRLGIEVAGVVGSEPRARAWRRPGRRTSRTPYESFEAMLADDRVDVVHLATPNHLHDGQVRAVLAAGKHVVCEKPLAMTSAQTTELLRARRRQRSRPRRQLQPALLPAEPPRPARSSRRARSATSGSSPAATCRTGCSTTPTGAGAWSASRAATCA